MTARLGELPGLQTYLSQLFELDILPSLVRDGVGEPEARRFFTEWMGRLELPLSPPPLPRTNRTSLVPPLVLIGHAASFTLPCYRSPHAAPCRTDARQHFVLMFDHS